LTALRHQRRRVAATDAKGSAHMSAEATLNRFTDFMVGPARFANLLSCFELGLIDMLSQRGGQTAVQLGETVGVTPAAVEQLLLLLVKEGFVAQDETASDRGCGSAARPWVATVRSALIARP